MAVVSNSYGHVFLTFLVLGAWVQVTKGNDSVSIGDTLHQVVKTVLASTVDAELITIQHKTKAQ